MVHPLINGRFMSDIPMYLAYLDGTSSVQRPAEKCWSYFSDRTYSIFWLRTKVFNVRILKRSAGMRTLAWLLYWLERIISPFIVIWFEQIILPFIVSLFERIILPFIVSWFELMWFLFILIKTNLYSILGYKSLEGIIPVSL